MSIQLQPGDAILHAGTHLRYYRNPEHIYRTTRVAEVLPSLDAVAHDVAEGRTAVGFVAYEAAPAFDHALRVHPTSPEPLCWFGLYPNFETIPLNSLDRSSFTIGHWTPQLDEAAYRARVTTIRDLIAAGDTYQVNFTFPLYAPFTGDPLTFFLECAAMQRGQYSTLIHCGDRIIVSISPELFFETADNSVTMRPMKGTMRRGLWSADDADRARALAASEKDRAENIMIVDMVRNDLGRIAGPGTVHTGPLFEVERYPTLWQMTSTVTAHTAASVPKILRAVFPSASVTGAPKVRTMQIIHDLEPDPRGIYCGAIGEWTRTRATFAVAIRTAVIDCGASTVRYSVGSGVTWDSTAENEYRECLLKADAVRTRPISFELLETIRWENGFHYLDEHLNRLQRSAEYFDIPLDRRAIVEALESTVTREREKPQRVRLLVDRAGAFHIESAALTPAQRLRVQLDTSPTPSDLPFLYHKTTHRAVYEEARQRHPHADDVILINERGELTESTIANLVLRIDGLWYTPPVHCGLLAGTMRESLLRDGTLHERVLYPSDLRTAESVRLINSVRGWIEIDLLD